MYTSKNWLQLFAEGAPGEAGTDAGCHRAQEGQDAAAETTEGTRLTWEQIKQDPEYSAHMQAMVRDRLKNAKQAQQVLETLSPALRHLAQQHGMDPEAPDYAALAERITQGTSEEALQKHFMGLQTQAKALSQRYPGFQLQKELEDPRFLRLTAPGTGVTLEEAYYTLHRKEIEAAALQVAAQKTAQRISHAMASGTMRPRENGTAGPMPSVTAFDYKNASRQQREALKTRIRQAGARGEKVYPGSM